MELFCAAYYNARKGWINDTFNSLYIRVMLLVVVKGKTIFSLYVMLIFLLIEIILYFSGKVACDSRAKYPEGWYSLSAQEVIKLCSRFGIQITT